MVYVVSYFIVALFFMLLNAFVAGYNGTDFIKKDFYESLIWPIGLMQLIGSFVRIIKETRKKKETNGK